MPEMPKTAFRIAEGRNTPSLRQAIERWMELTRPADHEFMGEAHRDAWADLAFALAKGAGDAEPTPAEDCGHLRDGGICIECAVPEPTPAVAEDARADRLERALEEAREAIREWFAAEAANPASASLEDGSAWWSRRASARARLRALVSTEGEAQR